MAHWKEMFSGGEYLSGPEFKGKTFTARIKSVDSTTMEDDDGKKRSLPIVTWDVAAKPWLMCKKTCYCLAAMFGEDPAGWVGKRVTLHALMEKVAGSPELCVRVKGGPDLPKAITIKVKMPRKKPETITLVPTGKTAAPAAAAPPPPEREPGADDGPADDDNQQAAEG